MSNTNTALVLESVLAGLVASYDTVEETPKVSKPRKVRAARAEKAPQADAPRKVVSTIPNLPEKGSLNAAGFLLALQQAGKIRKANEAGIMITLTDSKKEKVDQIAAIAAFVGYNFSGAHGTQLDMARSAAQRELRPVRTESVAVVTVAGYVAGMPNALAVKVNDLKARIRLANETMLDQEKEARKFDTDSEAPDAGKYATHMALAAVESERIAHMRRDLANLVGE